MLQRIIITFCILLVSLVMGATRYGEASAATVRDHDHQAGCACGCAHRDELCGVGICCHVGLTCQQGACRR